MVYSTVSIVLGAVLTKEELETLDFDEVGETLLCRKNVEIFRVPHNEDLYIIGLQMHVYYHKTGLKCGSCPKHSLCDSCIGQTNNGYYDVRSMNDRAVEVNLRHVCLFCFSDNKADLGAPKENLPVVGGRCVGPENPEGIKCCNTCGHKPDFRFSPQKSSL